MTRRLQIGVGLFAAALAAPAFGQTLVPTNVVALSYGRCVVDRDLAAARAAVMAPNGNEGATALNRIIRNQDNCLIRYSRLSTPQHMLRGAIAESLLERSADARSRLATLGTRAPTRPEPVAPEAFGDAVAHCVAEAEPVRSLAIFDADLNTSEERAKMIALKTIVDACVPVSGRQQLRVADLRSHLATALVRMAERLPSSSGEVR